MRGRLNKDLCRMCGERYTGLKSVDIYESRGPDEESFDVLLRDLLNLTPTRGDGGPERLGIKCATLLDDWAKFRKKCCSAQQKLQNLQAQQEAKAKAAQVGIPQQVQQDCKQNENLESPDKLLPKSGIKEVLPSASSGKPQLEKSYYSNAEAGPSGVNRNSVKKDINQESALKRLNLSPETEPLPPKIIKLEEKEQ